MRVCDIVLGVIVALCASGTEAQERSTPPAIGITITTIQELLARDEPAHSQWDQRALRSFYQSRNYRLAWSGEPAAERRAALAMAAMRESSAEGLNPDDYRIGVSAATPPSQSPARGLAEHDVELTDAFLHYMRDVRTGRISPRTFDHLIELEPETFDAGSLLAKALVEDNLSSLIADLLPPHEEYARLRSELAHYRAIRASGGWSKLPAGPEIVLSGKADPRFILVRDRLIAEFGNAAVPAANGDLKAAIKVYQSRNGLEPDGRLGSRTLAMLNVPVEARIEQIAANMERWRWMPRHFEPRYIRVNIADTTLEIVENAHGVLASRIIAGNPRTPTPMFRAEITGVTVNPPWSVPASIAQNEILPRLRKDPRYLTDHHMVLTNGPMDDPYGLSIDWKSVSRNRFPYQIRQLPGPDNALGKIKLELPNRFSVYLHDTPSRNLFARMDRHLSHGCVRVQEIVPLAFYIVEKNSNLSQGSLQDAIGSDATALFSLREPLPVYILYWTAVPNSDGSFGFRNDIYGRDLKLISALTGGHFTRVGSRTDLGCPTPV